MDPNEVLKTCQKVAKAIIDSNPDTIDLEDVVSLAHDLADSFEALDQWMKMARVMPEVWRLSTLYPVSPACVIDPFENPVEDPQSKLYDELAELCKAKATSDHPEQVAEQIQAKIAELRKLQQAECPAIDAEFRRRHRLPALRDVQADSLVDSEPPPPIESHDQHECRYTSDCRDMFGEPTGPPFVKGT